VAAALPSFRFHSPHAQVAILAAALCQWSCTAVRDDLFVVEANGVVRAPTFPPAAGHFAGTVGTGAPSAAGSRAPSAGAAADGGIVPGAAGSAGSLPPLASTPPFRWKETVAFAGACQAATFMGQFNCAVDGLLGQNKFAGTITLVLKGSSETQLFNVDRGQILVFDEDMKLVVSTEMTGLLDCSTQQLIAALVPKSSEMMPPERIANWLSVNPTPVVSGKLKGPLDSNLQTIAGDITLVFEPMPKCPGTFSMQVTPRGMP
jgi:hypothetical protein